MDAHPEPGGEASRGTGAPLSERVRLYLEALPPSVPTITYVALVRALGFSRPGSLRRVTGALEDTMHEDARSGRPFIAARAVSRVGGGLPGRGFFDLALDLARGPQADETERAFHAREMERLEREGSPRA